MQEAVKIAFVGDVNPSLPRSLSRIQKSIKSAKSDMWGHLEDVKLIVSNLETPISEPSNAQKDSIYSFAGSPESLLVYSDDQRHIVSIANNHIMDCGKVGLETTIASLNEHQILSIGAGSTLSQASEPHIETIGSKKFLFVACAEPHFSPSSETSAGNNPADFNHIRKILSCHKNKVNRTILSIHGGQEFVPYPSSWQIKLVEELIDLVDVFHFHHSHISSGTEVRNGSIIIWGSGNHVFEPILPIKVKGWNESITRIIEFPEDDNVGLSNIELIVKKIGKDGFPRSQDPKYSQKIIKKHDKISKKIVGYKINKKRIIYSLRPNLLLLYLIIYFKLFFVVWGPKRTLRYVKKRFREVF